MFDMLDRVVLYLREIYDLATKLDCGGFTLKVGSTRY